MKHGVQSNATPSKGQRGMSSIPNGANTAAGKVISTGVEGGMDTPRVMGAIGKDYVRSGATGVAKV